MEIIRIRDKHPGSATLLISTVTTCSSKQKCFASIAMQGKVDNALVQQPLVASSVFPANFKISFKNPFSSISIYK
jgi:hypothetical protein